MKTGIKFPVYILFLLLFSSNIFGQSIPVKFAVVNKLDRQLTHLYVTSSSNENDIPTTYNFSLGDYIIDEVKRVMDTMNTRLHTNYEVISLDIPKEFNPKLGYFNVVGKPLKKIRQWSKQIHKEDNVWYVIIIDSHFPRPDSKDKFLTGYDYGIATYDNLNNLITYFTMVRYIVFRTEPVTEVEWEYKTNYAKDLLLFDFHLDEIMTLEERQKIPDEHLIFTIQNITEMSLIQVEKILRSIVHDININRIQSQ